MAPRSAGEAACRAVTKNGKTTSACLLQALSGHPGHNTVADIVICFGIRSCSSQSRSTLFIRPPFFVTNLAFPSFPKDGLLACCTWLAKRSVAFEGQDT